MSLKFTAWTVSRGSLAPEEITYDAGKSEYSNGIAHGAMAFSTQAQAWDHIEVRLRNRLQELQMRITDATQTINESVAHLSEVEKQLRDLQSVRTYDRPKSAALGENNGE